jgi:hypothetical protein
MMSTREWLIFIPGLFIVAPIAGIAGAMLANWMMDKGWLP